MSTLQHNTPNVNGINYKATVDPLWKVPKAQKPTCKTCGSFSHSTAFCFQTKKKKLKLEGKQAIKWRSERKLWMEKNLPDKDGLWYCHYCGAKLVGNKDDPRIATGEVMFLTIDHIIPRSNTPSKRYDFADMVPCCHPDNVLKGSQSYARFCERWYPHLLIANKEQT